MRKTARYLLLSVSLCVGFSATSNADDTSANKIFELAQQAYQAQDYKKAHQSLEPLAEAGHREAQIYMGAIYDRGLGVERDLKRAIYWFEQAAEQGGIKLQYDLGIRYLYGREIERDYDKAHYWLQKAADAGAAQAQYNLALMHIRGSGMPVDHQKAIELFRLAADQGLRDAQYALGLAYTTGQHLPLDYAEAHRLFKLSAEQGYPSAQYNLAALTESGEGVTADIKEALIWYRKAAEQGHELAQERLEKLEKQPVTATITTPAAMMIHDQRWIKKQPASNYTIQINYSHDKEKLIRWLKTQQPLAPLAYFPYQQNGKVVYKAIYGSFADSTAAQHALKELPESLGKLKPWPRMFLGVQKGLSAY